MDKTENDNFKGIVRNRVSQHYYPSFKAANLLNISGRALSKITSSFMVLTSDSSKNNLGLSLKFEAKSLKVIDYSRKEGRYWEFSERTVDLIREYKVITRTLTHALFLMSHVLRRNSLKYFKCSIKTEMVNNHLPSLSLYVD